MKKLPLLFSVMLCMLVPKPANSWGFFAHQKINYYAVFLLPPEMLVYFKANIIFLTDHAVDPDKRRFSMAAEAPRHYIDIDHYGAYPFDALPRKWDEAIKKFGADSLQAYGIVPWHIQFMMARLTRAFSEKDIPKILKTSAELGHYIADAHVPLHTNSNHNGQLTQQQGIHAFWESRIPELLADKTFNFFIGKAEYLPNTGQFIWNRVMESALAADSVLRFEKLLSHDYPDDKKFAFEEKNGKIMRQYSSAYTKAYNHLLHGMVERRMRQSIFAVASCWYTAWVNAGQPDLKAMMQHPLSDSDKIEFDQLNKSWMNAGKMIGREE